MSDALSKFISGLATLDPKNLNAPANQAAFAKFQSLDNTAQRDVLNGLAAKAGTTFDRLASLSPEQKVRVADNVRAGRNAMENIEVADAVQQSQQASQPSEKPQSFEQRWANSAEKSRTNPPPAVDSDAEFARRHGAEAARVRHGYVSPERGVELNRISAIQSEARQSGKTFSEVADAFAAAGK